MERSPALAPDRKRPSLNTDYGQEPPQATPAGAASSGWRDAPNGRAPNGPPLPDDAGPGPPPVPAELRPTLEAIASGRDAARVARAARIAEFAVAIGGAFRVAKRRREQLYEAAFLHAALHEGPAPADQRLAQRHVEDLLRAFEAVDLPDACRELVRHHHERYDGLGSPGAALRGEAIPLAARILLVAEAFGAMSFERSYQRTLSVDEALQRLAIESGRQYDPTIVEYLRTDDGRRIIEATFGRGAAVRPELEGPAPQVVGRLRQRLAQKPAGRAAGGRRKMALAASAAALALLGGGFGLASTSSDALPGDALYPVKRGVEDAQLLLTTGDGDLDLHRQFAKTRLREAEQLIEQERNVPDALLEDLSHETDVVASALEGAAGDERYELAVELRDFGQRAEATLAPLNGVTEKSRAVLAEALLAARTAAYAGALAVAQHDDDGAADGDGAPDGPGPGPGPDASQEPAAGDSSPGGGQDGQNGANDGHGRPEHAATPGPPPHADQPDEPPGNSGDAPGNNK